MSVIEKECVMFQVNLQNINITENRFCFDSSSCLFFHIWILKMLTSVPLANSYVH